MKDDCIEWLSVTCHKYLIHHNYSLCHILVTPNVVFGVQSTRESPDKISTKWNFTMDTGNCKVNYKLQFPDVNDNEVGVAMAVDMQFTKTFSSASERDSVVSIQVQAVFLSKSGNWSEAAKLSIIQKPTDTSSSKN